MHAGSLTHKCGRNAEEEVGERGSGEGRGGGVVPAHHAMFGQPCDESALKPSSKNSGRTSHVSYGRETVLLHAPFPPRHLPSISYFSYLLQSFCERIQEDTP